MVNTPKLKEKCLVMFGKGLGVDTQVCKQHLIIIINPFLSMFSCLSCSVFPLGPSPTA